MCQTLVERVARSRQLSAIADPELLVLFEDWFEELEDEVRRVTQGRESMDEAELAARLGVSRRGAAFLLSKLERERQSR